MRRREVITLIGATAAFPLAGRAQQSAVPVIGYIHLGSAAARRNQVAAFQQGLNEQGLVEGRNVAIEYRWADGQYDRLPELAADLIRRRVSVIAAPSGTGTTLAAKALTTTIPIVFSTSMDPVRTKLVASLNWPGGNVTGIIDMGADIAAKHIELLHELLPAAKHLLVNPKGLIAEQTVTDVLAAAAASGTKVEVLNASTDREIDAAFATILQKRTDALLIGVDGLFTDLRAQISALAARYAVPTISQIREFVEAGGLMSYGSSINDRERQLGVYTGRILKGEKPADLPILRASKFEFVINLRTAKALGLDIPPALLATADEVIE